MESSEQNVFSSVKLCASPMTETDVTSFALRYETSAGVVLTVEFKFLKLKVHLVCLT